MVKKKHVTFTKKIYHNTFVRQSFLRLDYLLGTTIYNGGSRVAFKRKLSENFKFRINSYESVNSFLENCLAAEKSPELE